MADGEYRGLIHRNSADLAAWLAKRPSETALEPDLPIIDPHHHLWDAPHRDRGRYFLPELLEDTGGGHNIVSTVFLECQAMFRAAGPEEMKPVGEVEFVNGVAAQSASGQYGKTRACEAIIGWADLMLGARVRSVLEAEIGRPVGRFHLGHDLPVAGEQREPARPDRLEMGAARHDRDLVAGVSQSRREIAADGACPVYANPHASLSAPAVGLLQSGGNKHGRR